MKDMFFLNGITGGRIGYKRINGKKTNVKQLEDLSFNPSHIAMMPRRFSCSVYGQIQYNYN
jgi:hypothetical protein